jgi:twinkle protein
LNTSLTTASNQTHLPCPSASCTSSDGYSVDPKTGWGKCFVCNYRQPPEGKGSALISTSDSVRNDRDNSVARSITPVTDVYRAAEHRGIPRSAVEKFKIDLVQNDEKLEARYPYYKDGKHVANKVRSKDKKFYWEGESKEIELFGQSLFSPNPKLQVTVVEGEYDAAAAYVLLGSRYPVVSVSSAGTAVRDVKNNFEYLDGFGSVVLALDGDEVGQATAKKIAEMGFKPGKVRIVTMKEGKDPNDYLKAGKSKEFQREWWDAPAYMPDGIKLGRDMWDEIINRPKHFQVDYPFAGLNRLTYGIRLSEMVVVTAETGIGKTSILKEVEYSLLANPELKEKGYGVGFIHLEEPNYDTALGLMSIHANKPYHLPDTERTVDELRSAYDAVINSSRVVIWDHFGSNTVEAVLDKIRHMHALGCKYIVLDHLSIVVSDQSGDERKQLDEIATKAKTLCMELNLSLICVIHQNRQGQIRGTTGVEQLANIVIKLYRNNTDLNEWRRNVTKIVVEKNRFCGRTGPACYLFYNGISGRLEELSQEEAEAYELGESVRDDQVAF